MADLIRGDAHLGALLASLDPKARDDLRRVLIRDHAVRDSISSRLMRYRGGRGDDWADIIDMLSMHPEERREGGADAERDRRQRLEAAKKGVGQTYPWNGQSFG